jgi:hypothetical protein
MYCAAQFGVSALRTLWISLSWETLSNAPDTSRLSNKAKQGLHGSGARSAATLKHGIIVLRHVISILDNDMVLRRLGFRFSVPFVVVSVDEDRIFWRPKPKRRRNIPVSIPPAAVLLDCRPVGDRCCGPRRRELDGKSS